MSFFVTLPSDSSLKYFPNNTTSKFRTYLPEALKLNGSYEVAITEINYPRTWFNVKEDRAIKITLDEPPKAKMVIIPKGCYETIHDLLAWFKKIDGIVFIYEGVMKKVSINFQSNYVISIPGDTAVMLGFTLDDKQDYVVTKPMLAPYIVDLDASLHSLFIYSDVVKNTIVCDSNAPLLRIVSAKGKDGETVNTEFFRPHYPPVASSDIQTIEVNIMDD